MGNGGMIQLQQASGEWKDCFPVGYKVETTALQAANKYNANTRVINRKGNIIFSTAPAQDSRSNSMHKATIPAQDVFMLSFGDPMRRELEFYSTLEALKVDVASLSSSDVEAAELENAATLEALRELIDESTTLAGDPDVGHDMPPTTAEGVTYAVVVYEDLSPAFYSFGEIRQALHDDFEGKPELQKGLAKAATVEELEDFAFEAGWDSWGYIQKIVLR